MSFTQDLQPIKRCVERLDGVLAELDVSLVLPTSLTDLVALGEHIERVGTGLKTLAAARIARTELWRAEGDRSAEAWLARQTGTSAAEAARLLDTGRKLEHLPATADAVSRGELSAKQAEVIAGAAAVDPSAELRLLDRAHDTSLRELQDECRRTRASADPDPDATARRAHARRSYRTWTDADGATGHIHLSGPVDTIARIDNAVRHRADKIFRSARCEGRREPTDAYTFDAVTELLTNDGDDLPVPVGADAKIIVRIDHSALLRGRAVDGETCEIAGVGPIPVAVAREWMADAFLAAVLTKGEEVQRVVHLGRRFTAVQRTALQWQDPVCARKGCTNRLGLEYDHFEDWADTHTTRVKAGKRFCHTCHRLKSTGWQVSPPDETGQCTFTPPDERSVAEAAGAAVAAQRVRRARSPGPPRLLDTG